MDNYNELQSKIDSIECELARAKLELESSKKDDLIMEVDKFIGTAIDEQAIFGSELSFDLTADLNIVKGIIESLIREGEAKDYSMAKTYFNSFREKYLDLRKKIEELNSARGSLETMVNILRAEKSLQKKDPKEDYGITPEVAEI